MTIPRLWVIVVVGLVLFLMFTNPVGLASLVHGIGMLIGGFFQGLSTFLTTLMSQFGLSA